MGAKQVKSWAQTLKPYNTWLIFLGFGLDGLVVAWAYMDGQLPPALYGAITGLLKAANLGIHFINKKVSEEVEGGDKEANPEGS
ncbi:hypothetical protein [Pseudomonas sp. PNPG3]|uniref:hypothetical protein n=1 Tax=Pseudomonas sp. PNPG3 TaxID=2919497 RepID=UPI001FFC5D23|nr:hypothetical protein [Pseudomonas sp. PNPG3]MCK2122139.1 hypothetical protein [Pseudomonas sp. PNPG3]